MTTAPPLTIRAIRPVAVDVPMRHVLGTSAAAVRTAPLLLLDLETEEGITGRSYVFCYLPAAAAAIIAILTDIERQVKGSRVAPVDLWAKLTKRFTLIGVQGVVRMAMAALDVACWDALAIASNLPLATMLGAGPRKVRVYNSCGLGLKDTAALADEAEELLDRGRFAGVKVRLGYPTLAEDVAAVHAVRERIGEAVPLMADYNQALSVAEAMRRGLALDGLGLEWIEEPIRHDDYRGCAELARALATPIQIGENFSGPFAMDAALDAGACDYVMPDLERIGGVTGWQRAAGIAAGRGIEMSSHLFPEVSAHLLAATPTAHWLEYMDWAETLLEQPLELRDGHAIVPDRPGAGLSWDRAAVERHRMK